jgi:hypothetical protein
MAKNSTVKVAATSRIRFVMVDAEIADGDIGPITQAIQNALRGPAQATTVKRIAAPVPANSNGVEVQELEPADEENDEIEVIGDAAQPARQARAKRSTPKTPKIVTIDMNAPISLATFAQGKDAKSQHKKYMIAAAWLKEHRETDAVTGDHIYTCFRSMGWSTSIPDFGQPLRDLKTKLQYFDKSDKGYEINHIGLDFVKKLGGSDGAS